VVAYEDVVVACGHVEKFGLFEDKKDKFRDARRQKLASKPCKACRALRQKAEQERQAQARKARKEKAAQGGRAEQLRRFAKGRLPDGAIFHVAYAAATESWSGTLTIGENVFHGSASALFHLLRHLDQQFRNFLAGTLVLGTPPKAQEG
jgi:hypothetical protein